MVSLRVRSFIGKVSVSPFLFRKSNTCFTSHLPVYFGWGGRRWYTPFIRRETRGCLPIWKPSNGIWVVEIGIQGTVLFSLVELISKEFQNILYSCTKGIDTLWGAPFLPDSPWARVRRFCVAPPWCTHEWDSFVWKASTLQGIPDTVQATNWRLPCTIIGWRFPHGSVSKLLYPGSRIGRSTTSLEVEETKFVIP